jgi:hypothetical protein
MHGTAAVERLTDRPMSEDHSPRFTLAATLERDRLERRRHRLELVVDELQARARARRARSGHVPAALGQAIADFQAQLRSVQERLAPRPADAAPARRPRGATTGG